MGKSDESSPSRRFEESSPQKPKPNRSVFRLFKPKPETPESPKKSIFGFFGKEAAEGKEGKDETGSATEASVVEQPEEEEEEVQGNGEERGQEEEETTKEGEKEGEEGEGEEGEEEEGEEEEKKEGFEDKLRNTLRKLGVEVDDEDDWKQMVIKTRLTLKALKDSILGAEGMTDEERTKTMKIVINDDNILEIKFRLDFSHYTPPPSDPGEVDPDEIEIPPDLTGLQSPSGKEPLPAKKKRLKRILKAIKKAQKLNKKRILRLEETRLRKAQEESEAGTCHCDDCEEKEAEDKESDEADENEGDQEQGDKVEGEEGEEEEDKRTFIEKMEDDTGIKIIINTDVLDERIKEYREIFFGPDLTEEELAELEKIKTDDKEFYVHLKFIVRKKTFEEKEEERLAAEEEARRKAEEEGGDQDGEDKEEEKEEEEEEEEEETAVLDEADERRRQRRHDLREKASSAESEEDEQYLDFENVPVT